jgi:hypothetical protein
MTATGGHAGAELTTEFVHHPTGTLAQRHVTFSPEGAKVLRNKRQRLCCDIPDVVANRR